MRNIAQREDTGRKVRGGDDREGEADKTGGKTMSMKEVTPAEEMTVAVGKRRERHHPPHRHTQQSLSAHILQLP
jgi:hypothetical protein